MRIRSSVVLAALVVLTLSACTSSNEPPPPSVSASNNCGGERPARPDGGNYVCTFTDDFTSPTLDTSKWVVATTARSGFTTGTNPKAQDCYVDSPRNHSISKGQLHLTARTEAKPFVCQSPLGDFTTSLSGGSVVSFGKFAQAYGRFEFRARFPATTQAGVDSALWLYPQALKYGPWPNSGEIDVAEWFGSSKTDAVVPSVHYAGENRALSSGYNCTVPGASTAFHTYRVDWTKEGMSFYYDDKLCYTHVPMPTAPLVAPQPFDNAFDLVMTQTGGTTAPVGSKITMDVDWVRVWQ